MSLIDKILKRGSKSEIKKEIKLQKGVNTVQSIIEETESHEEAAHKAVNAAIEEIQSHPEMPVGEFIKRLQKNTDLSDVDLVKIIKQLPYVKSEEETIEAVEATDLSSQKIAEIIEDAPIRPDIAQKIVEQIPDEDIQKEQQAKIEKELEEQRKQTILKKKNEILNKLSEIYNKCDEIEAPKLVDQINSLNIEDRTQEIEKKILDVVAKRVALDCMKYGDPRLKTLTKIIPATEMFEADLPFLAQKEYKTIKSDYDEQGKEYIEYGPKTKELVKKLLIDIIAQKSAETYDEIGDFNIPQTERFQNLSNDDVQSFVDTVQTYSEEIDKVDSDRLESQLKGESVTGVQDINSMLEKMKPRDKEIAIQNIVELLRNSNKQENKIDKGIEEIKSKIKSLPTSMQSNTVQIILNVLDEQREAMDMWKKHKKKAQISTGEVPHDDKKENDR